MKLDKILHFLVGLAAMVLVTLITSVFIGLIVTTTLAASKEIRDIFDNGTPEWWDFHITLFGGFFGWLLLKLFGMV